MIRYHDLKTEQALDSIEAFIDRNRLKGGGRLPSERELAAELALSRGTVRSALAELEREGRIERRQGKGAFMAPVRHSVSINAMQSFSSSEIAAGNTPSSRLISFTKKKASSDISRRLSLRRDTSVYEIARLRLANGTPVIIETASIPERLLPGLERYDFEKESLYAVIERDYHLHLMDQKLDIRLSRATEEEARLFGLSDERPIVFVETGLTRDEKGRPLEYTKSILLCRAVEYQISFDRGAEILLLDRGTLPVLCRRDYPGLDELSALKKAHEGGRLISFLYDGRDSAGFFQESLPYVDYAFICGNDEAAEAAGHIAGNGPRQIICLTDSALSIVEGSRTVSYRTDLKAIPPDGFRRAYLFGAARDWSSDKCALYALSRYANPGRETTTI